LGWKLDKEDFLKNNNTVSELKLRAGIGRVGNQQIGDIARFGLFDTLWYYASPIGRWFLGAIYEHRNGLFSFWS
jgi:hypothetical protein